MEKKRLPRNGLRGIYSGQKINRQMIKSFYIERIDFIYLLGVVPVAFLKIWLKY